MSLALHFRFQSAPPVDPSFVELLSLSFLNEKLYVMRYRSEEGDIARNVVIDINSKLRPESENTSLLTYLQISFEFLYI